MKIRNNNPLDLEGADGETITVGVNAAGTVSSVAFNLNGAAWAGGSFALDQAKNDPAVLVAVVTFSTPHGGLYEFDVRGSAGGFAHYSVVQLPNQTGNAIAFTFDVV